MRKKKKKFKTLKTITAIILVIITIILYGTYIEPKQLKINETKIKNQNITENLNGFKIVSLSDIHYGNNLNIKDLKKIIKKINQLNPDIVVITGDLIDQNTNLTATEANKIKDQLKKIKATSGKYIIEGENDTKEDEWENIVTNSDFINLNNTYDTIYKEGYESILIAGVSSFSDKESIINKNQKTQNYINSFEKNGPIYKILIMHEPDYIDDLTDNKYDLILAGHSHGGQIKLPYIGGIITLDGATKYKNGHYKIKNSDLYVSSGIGNTKINFRFFNKPTIDVYRLVNE